MRKRVLPPEDLTEKEYNQLKADFSGLDSLIEQLSAYIQSTGKKYADHAATLRIWAKRQKLSLIHI